MIKIQDFSNNIFNNIGFQEYNLTQDYKMFNYCITQKIDDNMLVYNTFTSEMLLFSLDEYNSIFLYGKNDNIKVHKYLIRHWFLIPKNSNDFSITYTFLQVMRRSKPDMIRNLFTYTILTTTDCNARCSYCYEADYKRIKMSEETALDVVNYIEKTHYNKVSLQWFGGEPLCNGKAIDIICSELKKRKIPYSSNMITNGYLFDEYDLDVVLPLWKLNQVQITLDGMEEKYNNIKRYIDINSGSPFHKVINNIHSLSKKYIKVNVRINISESNIDDLYPLVDYLYDEFGKYKTFSVYSYPLFRYWESQDSKIFDEYSKLQDYILLKRLRGHRSLQHVHISHCMADNKKSVVITPEGNLSLCEHYIYGELIGNIYENKLDSNVIDSWAERYYCDECQNCKLYPQCTLLKKCPVSNCSESYRNYIEDQIKKSMVRTYEKYLENKKI